MFVLVVAFCGVARAQTSMLPADAVASYTYYDSVPGGSAVRFDVQGQEFSRGVRIATAGSGENLWSAQLGWENVAPAAQGDVILLTFWARRVGPLDGRPIDAQFVVVERNGGNYDKSLIASVPNDGAQWRRYAIAFRAHDNFAAGGLRFAFQFSSGPQTFEIGGISALNFARTREPRDLPTDFYYGGRENDAAWRVAAEARIERIRKGDLRVRVVNQAGRPMPGVTVRALLQQPEFRFGTAVAGDRLVRTDADSVRYRETFLADFPAAVIENHLKWPFWETWAQPDAPAAVAWLRSRNIPTRGHNIIWPDWNNMPDDTRTLSAAELRSRIDARFANITSATAGAIEDWDVVNEPYSSFDVQGRPLLAGVTPSPGVLGNEEIVRWFQQARTLAPGVALTLNDYNVWEGLDGRHRDFTFELVRWMQARGAPIDRLGLQAHFAHVLLPITELERRVDRLATLGLRLIVTEYDTSTLDERLQADYLRDVLTLAFSREEFVGFLLWGFWEGSHWVPEGALYRTDWTAKPAAAVWRDLVRNRWTTDVRGTTVADGVVTTRGFTGAYRIDVASPGGTATRLLTLPRTGAEIVVTLDE